MTTGYVYDPGHRAHTHPQAPDSAERLEALLAYLEARGELAPLVHLPVEPVPWDWIAAVHSYDHVWAVQRLACQGKQRISFDTYLSPAAAEVARLGASSAVWATKAVLEGRVTNAFSLMRPCGHHALPTRAMGYCIFNNVAVAASYALREHRLQRVMVLDIDAHHGNGTEAIFYGRRDVLFLSTHQQPWFPGTGDWHRCGEEAGMGYNYNVEMPQWSGDESYSRVLRELIAPLVERYRPQLILVSAGFDAHWMDHSSVLGLSVRGYAHLVSGFRQLAERYCQGRLVLVLEGGYNRQAFHACVAGALRALRGAPELDDPLGPCPDRPVAAVDGSLALLRGFMEMVVPPEGPDYYDQPVQVPYEVR